MKSILLAGVCLCVAAAPAAGQVLRVSVSTAGVQANGPSRNPSISGDGRVVAFESWASNLVEGDTNGDWDIFVRDRDTDFDGILDEPGAVSTIRVNVGPHGEQQDFDAYRAVVSGDGRFVFWNAGSLYRFDRTLGIVLRVASGLRPRTTAAVSADGDVIVYESGPVLGDGLTIRVTSTDALLYVPAPYVPAAAPGGPERRLVYASPTISSDGRIVAYVTGERTSDPFQSNFRAWEFDRISGVTRELSGDDPQAVGITGDGAATVLRYPTSVVRRVNATGAQTPALPAPMRTPPVRPIISPLGRYAVTESALLHDFDLGVTTDLGFEIGGELIGCATATWCMPWGAISGDERFLAVASPTSTLVPDDTNGFDDVFVIDLRDQLDADDDTMDDRWEALFAVTDPVADPDGDGQTNAQEEDAGTHPNGQIRRFLAEGATGVFFETTIALANPSPTLAATAVLTFDKGDGTRSRVPVVVPAGRSAVVNVGSAAGVSAADVSTTVESDRPIAVERSMRWGSPTGAFFGSHAETATTAPSTTWFLAEGSTVLGFNLFYLLQNPQTGPTNATVRFLLPSGQVVTRTYALPPRSRTTVWVNEIQGLDQTDVSGDISADAPIIVERAMYRYVPPDQSFGLGHGAMGVPAASTSWFLAEGATGDFFDLYVLIATPGDADAIVRADYARSDGSVITQTYRVAAHSRHSVYVDAIAGLEAGAIATTLTSINGVPVVAERAMYWPGGYFDYYEGHVSAGSTVTALTWVVAAGENAGAANAQTYVLIANTANTAGEATVTVLPDRGFTGTVPAPIVVPLPASSRTTVPVTSLNGPFGVRVDSGGASAVPIVVEGAVYRSENGQVWSSGSNALATPVP
jgi:hypothetical protein